MKPISYPLKPDDRGDEVANLQEGLLFLIEKRIIQQPPHERPSLSVRLAGEKKDATYGRATEGAVKLFQRQHDLQAAGEVDEPSAAALNRVLRELGVIEEPPPPPPDQRRTVSGRITHEDGRPLPGAVVRAHHVTERDARRLGEDTTDAEGRYTIRYEPLPGVESINLRVTVLDADGNPLCESDVIRGAKPLEVVNLIVPGDEMKTYRVEGKVASRVSAGIGGLRVVIVDKGVGGDLQLAQAETDEGGAYQATFTDKAVRGRGKAQPDLQARVFTGDVFLGASDVRYNASQSESLNVLLEDEAASALRSEHEVLTSALSKHFAGRLGDLKETDEQQDITFLANKTGWDARAVALAALADQFSAKTADASGDHPIPREFFYALFRAGLPANEDTLYQADAKTLEGVWKQAAAQGVIPQVSAEEISNLISRFQALSAERLLTGPAIIGTSPVREMLRVSRLSREQQESFAKLYAANAADMLAFWEAVGRDETFGKTPDERDKMVKRLQLDGKLGFLTINNAPLMQMVHEEVHDKIRIDRLSDMLQLAQLGYHRPEQWSQLLKEGIPIPNEIPGDGETKRNNYAEYLAAHVRLSYPTASVAEMIKSRALKLMGAEDETADLVHAFLTEHQGKFEIGVEPVEQYLKRNNIKLTPEQVKAVAPVKRVQRVYQITPNDQAMTGLMKRGIDSAYHVVRYDRDAFVRNFTADLGGVNNAEQTYDRSVEIHNAVLNIALSYLNARTAPAIGVHSPTGVLDPTPAHAKDIIANAKLEDLFGSMDFCACDHCRSILSPAAYLVDLLQFLDQPDVPEGTTNPQTVLLERRPDIQHLPLTCENTNIALPYIDVVNETLEYYIANGVQHLSLKDYDGHDTDGATTEDLLACPQFVMKEAYDTLHAARFPSPLPFHQPLENLRRYFNKFEVPLPLAMERLRKSDVLDVDRKTNPPPPRADYGWRDILMEEIGLSRPEHELLTTSNATPNELLWQIYGYPPGTKDGDIINGNQESKIVALSNAKQFCRRIGITYEDLVAVLRTRFINPNSFLIPKLERLGVNFGMLAELKNKNDAATDAKFDALLAKLADPPDPAAYGDNPQAPKGDYAPIRTWVKNDKNYARIMGLVTLAIPLGAWAPKNPYTSGDCVRPKALPPESTLYFECTTSGVSDESEPEKWPTTPANTYTDGTVVWTCRDAASCLSFDNMAFCYSDPAKANKNVGAPEFVRLLRFIRLWKKLGWTIEQTDAAICALYPPPIPPQETFAETIDTIDELNNGFQTMLPRLGVIKRVMTALNLTPKRDLLPLLACFAPMDTHDGAEWFIDKDQSRRLRVVPSLYRQMFLNPALMQQDPVFADNGYGEFLHGDKGKLLVHAEALRSAFNLTGDEFKFIIDDLGLNTVVGVPYKHPKDSLEQSILNAGPGIAYDHQKQQLSYTGLLNSATRDALKSAPDVSAAFQAAVDALYLADQADLKPLTLTNISAIFRRGWLARKLKLSVRELLLLRQLTGLDPFDSSDPTSPAMLRLINLVQLMKDRSFKSPAALYLIWNQDLSGKSAPAPGQIAELARTLRSGLTQIEKDFAVVDDPTGEITRMRMALVYGTEAIDFFFGLLNNAFVTEVPYSRNQPKLITRVPYNRSHKVNFLTSIQYKHDKPDLEPEIKNAAAEIHYDNAAGILSFSGEMTQIKCDALKSAADDVIKDGICRELFKTSVDSLYDMNSKAVAAKLEQGIVNAAPGLLYDDTKRQLCFSGELYPAMRKALEAAANALPDQNAKALFMSAVDNLFNESQQVIHANLEQAIVDAADGLIAYDHFRKVLSYAGILSDETCSDLKNAANESISDANDRDMFIKAIDDRTIDETTSFGTKVIKNLKEKCWSVIDPFFEKYTELLPLIEAYKFFLRLRSTTAFKQPDAGLLPQISSVDQQRVGYDPNAGQLSYKGVLSFETCGVLKKAAMAIGDAGLKAAFDTAVDNLHKTNQGAIEDLFKRVKKTADQKKTLDVSKYKDAYIQANDSPEKQRAVLLRVCLPELIKQRKDQQALQIANSFALVDMTIASALLDNKVGDHYVLHAAGAPENPALSDLRILDTPGLAADYFYMENLPLPLPKADYSSDSEDNLAYSPIGNNTLPENRDPDKPISGIWSGFVEAPENAVYNLRVEGDVGATITVLLNDKEITLLQTDKLWTNKERIELKGGSLYSISIKAEGIKNTFKVSWSTPGRGWEVIPAHYLYSARFVERLRISYVRFLKAASLATGLALTGNEMAYLATHPDYRIDGDAWLSALSVDGSPAPAIAAKLVRPFEALLDFARIKAEISPSDESLLTVLKDSVTATKTPDSLLFRITRWNAPSLNEVLARFGKSNADLGHVDVFRRVYDALSIIQKMGVSAKALTDATTNEPETATVRDLQGALHARYDAASWRDVVRPINDEMRSLQRDALVAYILHQMRSDPDSKRIDTPEKLFEYFLMDVQMDPCMLTSRIRHALSSVQLFIERCLMNLETGVSASAFSAEQRKQWEWMKRYRVWEANRKVFLYPENWLEPELRDDKSPFFKEIESELLQSDITEERAATALLNYLSKLEEVAKLEPCGIHHIPSNDNKRTPEINHVVARTSGANRKYYYRRCEGVSWTPWEPIKLDIEDNPVIPVVWNGRLFLFWLRILKQAPLNLPNEPSTQNLMDATGKEEKNLANLKMTDIKKNAAKEAETTTKVAVQAVLCWSEYYNGKWQPTKTSDINRPIDLGTFPPAGQYAFLRTELQLWPFEDGSALRMLIGSYGSFLLCNTHSLPVNEGNADEYWHQALAGSSFRCLDTFSDMLTASYFNHFPSPADKTWPIVQNPVDDRVIVPLHPMQDAWDAPFFYEDSRHVFFVTTTEAQVPIDGFDKYGVHVPPGVAGVTRIPPPVFKVDPKVQLKPRSWGNGGPVSLDAGVIDPGPMERFVTEDAYIRRGIGTTAVVRYGDRQIGPAGAISVVVGKK